MIINLKISFFLCFFIFANYSYPQSVKGDNEYCIKIFEFLETNSAFRKSFKKINRGKLKNITLNLCAEFRGDFIYSIFAEELSVLVVDTSEISLLKIDTTFKYVKKPNFAITIHPVSVNIFVVNILKVNDSIECYELKEAWIPSSNIYWHSVLIEMTKDLKSVKNYWYRPLIYH